MAKEEQWRPIPGFGGWYECSDRGNFRSWKNGNGSARLQEPKPMKILFRERRGPCVSLRMPGEPERQYSVCRLMYNTWIGEVPKGMVVVRKDGNIENNRADNFVIVPPKQRFTPTVRKKIGKPTRKAVIKFDQALSVVDTYPSIKAAAQANHFSWKYFSNHINFRFRQSVKLSVILSDGFIYALDDDDFVRKTLTLAMKELGSKGIRYNDPFTEKYYDVSEPVPSLDTEEPEHDGFEAEDFEEVEVIGDIGLQEDGQEEWRDIPGYEGWYQVSSLGRVRCLMKRVPNSVPGIWVKRETPFLLRLTDSRGSLVTSLRDPESLKKQVVTVASLVYRAFIGPIPTGKKVMHHWALTDNRPENLFIPVSKRKPKEE